MSAGSAIRRDRSKDPELAADIARIEAIWADCRAHFGAGGPYLFGRYSLADAMYAPVVTRFATYHLLHVSNPADDGPLEPKLARPSMARGVPLQSPPMSWALCLRFRRSCLGGIQ